MISVRVSSYVFYEIQRWNYFELLEASKQPQTLRMIMINEIDVILKL